MVKSNSVAEFIEEVLPTPLQAVITVVISLVWILLLQREALLQHFAGGGGLEPATSHQLNLQVANVLGLSIVGQAAIIIFWSIIGLGAYLIVWWFNNLLIGARNQVIIKTSYANQAIKGINLIGPLLKLIFLGLLIAAVATIPYGINYWLSLWQELLTASFGWYGVALAVGSIAGFAAELYITFLLFQFAINRFRP